MDRLRAEQQEREYTAMVSSAVRPSNEAYFRPDDIKEMKSHLVTIANIGFSMAAVYVAVYMASRTMLDDLGLVKQETDYPSSLYLSPPPFFGLYRESYSP